MGMDAAKIPDPLRALIGRELDRRYRIEALIGMGGFGAVFRGRATRLPKPVAIKILSVSGAIGAFDATTQAKRFEQEAKATSLLSHPNTIQVFDFGTTDDGVLYLVMELLEGRTLTAARKACGTFTMQRTCSVGAQICHSLSEAHGHGIIHRDMKPDNVFLVDAHGRTDFVKVLDFGIAKLLDPPPDADISTPDTRTGLISGTPRYMAPEQALCEPPDARTDLYCLGVILYELLSGRPPFESKTPLLLLRQHTDSPAPPLGEHIPVPMRELVHAMLEKKRDDRPGSAAEVAARLQWIGSYVDGASPIAPTGAPSPPPPPQSSPAPGGPPALPTIADASLVIEPGRAEGTGWPARRTWALGGVAAVALLVAGLSLGTFSPGQREHASSGTPARAEPVQAATPDDSPPTVEGSEASAEPPPPTLAPPSPTDQPAESAVAPAAPPVAETPVPPRLVALRSEPAKVRVTRDGSEVCTTPCAVTLEAGSKVLSLSFSRAGYRPAEVTLEEAALDQAVEQGLDVKLERAGRASDGHAAPEDKPKTASPYKGVW